MKKIGFVWKSFFEKKSAPGIVTIKYMFPVIMLGIFAVLGAAAVTSDSRSYVRLETSQTLVMNGESFLIEVYAFAHIPVNAIDVAIEFSPEMVEIESVDTGRSVLTIWTQEPIIKGNNIIFSGGTFRRGFLGEHQIATIKVKAKYTGKTEFLVRDVKLLAGDGKGTPVSVEGTESQTKTSFVIYDQNENPEQISAKLGININPDIDNDGKVSLRDISVFMVAWHSKSVTYDFNNDGRMNFFDFSIILAKSFLEL